MKQIYNFEQAQPPVLNERMIRLQLEKRRLHFQTALIALASIFNRGSYDFVGLFGLRNLSVVHAVLFSVRLDFYNLWRCFSNYIYS